MVMNSETDFQTCTLPSLWSRMNSIHVSYICVNITLSILFSLPYFLPLDQNKANTLRNAMAQTIIFKLLIKWLEKPN